MSASSHTQRLMSIMQEKGRKIDLSKGEVIQSTDTLNNLCLITSGYAKKYLILNDGNLRVQIIYGPEDIFPLSMAFKAIFNQDLYVGPETYYYQTMTRAQMFLLDVQQLKECVKADPGLYRDLLSEAGRRLYSNIQRLENISLQTTYQRVAHQIAFYGTEFGEPRNGGVRINLPIIQQDLADVLSTTRETVSLSMSQLKKKSLIKSGRHLFIPNLNKLKSEAFK